jgi:hypothetical protein
MPILSQDPINQSTSAHIYACPNLATFYAHPK